MIYVNECNNCHRVWEYDTTDSIGSHNPQSCPQCNTANSTLLRIEE
ncbi:hypothetical protein C7437_1011463 [Psychrobacillus insolitus]|uniref:Uncharacterized protein n=1 Tax=Psychrobacillus insolitus TaxID=1461 RepID=A0A2W7ND12_9BACI|nr:hypothetical protein C7437_1011463 [Psychrobacillus insolitus]